MFGERNAFLIRLENALPIPDRSVSYDEVLNYRRRRNDEILALRHHIEDIAIAVGNSGFGGLEEQVAYEKFVQSIENYARVAKEENFLKRLTSLEIKFNWDKLVQNIPTSAALSAVFGKLAVLHAIGASISIESTLGMRKTSATPRPFDYLFIAKSEM